MEKTQAIKILSQQLNAPYYAYSFEAQEATAMAIKALQEQMEVNKKIVVKSIEHYGPELQQDVCMEECAELIQAISKAVRGKLDRSNLMEEMADVLICIETLKQIHGVSNLQLQHIVDKKQIRQKERLQAEKAEGDDEL